MPQSDSHHVRRYKLNGPDSTIMLVMQCSSYSGIVSSVHSATLNPIQTSHLGLGNHLHQVIKPKHQHPTHRNNVPQLRLRLSDKLIHQTIRSTLGLELLPARKSTRVPNQFAGAAYYLQKEEHDHVGKKRERFHCRPRQEWNMASVLIINNIILSSARYRQEKCRI